MSDVPLATENSVKGENGRHQADALLSNFSHWIVHPCDPLTAKAAAARLGKEWKTVEGGSIHPREQNTAYDELFGDHGTSFSWSQQFHDVLDPAEFMVGRTGGPINSFLCDLVVVKSGVPFETGGNYIKTSFRQM